MHLVADVSLFPLSVAGEADGTTTAAAPSSDHRQLLRRNNESIASGVAVLRVAPRIPFSSRVKPVCLPLASSGSPAADLLFATLAPASHDAGDAGAASDPRSLVKAGAVQRRRDGLLLLTDQRLELPRDVCADALRKSGGGRWMHQVTSDRQLMCALNSPLFTLNCRVITCDQSALLMLSCRCR